MNNYRFRHSVETRRSRRLIISLTVICLIATLGYLRSRLWVIDLSYEYHDLQKELQTLKDKNGKLRLDVRELRSPKRLEKIARDDLNLKERGSDMQTKTVVLREP